MGTLTDEDKNYLAQNFLAFFRRDYKRVAEAHVEAGWAPKDTRVNDFETAIRAVCEPIFDKPLKEISFGRVLLRLFQTSRQFNVEIQPQLVMLQKTLLNIEGLGRDLDPDLDLWTTAKPYLENWMAEQLGWRGLSRRLQKEASSWAVIMPQFPRLMHHALSEAVQKEMEEKMSRIYTRKKAPEPLVFHPCSVADGGNAVADMAIRADKPFLVLSRRYCFSFGITTTNRILLPVHSSVHSGNRLHLL